MGKKRFSKMVFAKGVVRYLGRTGKVTAWGIALCVLLTALATYAVDGTSPHLDPVHGVRRINAPWAPPGSCVQCHDQHALESGEPSHPNALFAENSNSLCYTTGGVGPCHQKMASNYPATEFTRIPEGFPDAGYMEYNSGGAKVRGVEYRSRWPGEAIYGNPGIVRGNHFISPHRSDPDMPRKDPQNRGSCLNCHNPHGSENPFDLLVGVQRGIGGFDELAQPSRYGICFNCHSSFGPPGMEESGRRMGDYYDSSLNGETAGHQIRMDPDIAISWPSHIRAGDKLPCYDCHNAHGSRGYNGEGPNAYLISDERPGWSNLTDPLTDPVQNRRFCFGCHVPSDGVPGSQVVEGIVMNTIPDRDEHRISGMRGCSECHGNDYSSSTSNNVHNPKN